MDILTSAVLTLPGATPRSGLHRRLDFPQTPPFSGLRIPGLRNLSGLLFLRLCCLALALLASSPVAQAQTHSNGAGANAGTGGCGGTGGGGTGGCGGGGGGGGGNSTATGITDIYLPQTMKVEWNLMSSTDLYTISRSPGPPITASPTVSGTHGVLVDTFAFSYGTTYTYTIIDTVRAAGCGGSLQTYTTHYYVIPMQGTLTDNQAVDARYDLRYSVWKFLNHSFNTSIYRGGLFAGYNADQSEVGHTYLQFHANPTSTALWPVGSVNAWYTRMYASGNVTIGCQTVATGWSGPSLVWTNAPSFTPASTPAAQQLQLSYNSASPAPAGWVHWTMATDIPAAVHGSGQYAVGLGGVSEPSTTSNPISGANSGWAYFARQGYSGGSPACILYAIKPQ